MRFLLLAALVVLTSLAATPAHDVEAVRCSLAPSHGVVRAGETVVLALATGDTLLAGPGAIRTGEGGGHSGSGAPGPIYGQLFRVQRLARADSARVAAVLERRGDDRVAIVPWDYDPTCVPVRWTRGFAWVKSAEPAVFTLTLRPDSLWVDGVPVFDAIAAATEPYPHSPLYTDTTRNYRVRERGPLLRADEYFELLRAVPLIERIFEQPASAWLEFSAWSAQHAHLLDRFPGNDVVQHIGRAVADSKAREVLQSIEPVIGGTWRMRVSLDGGAEREVWVRTRDRPTSAWLDRGESLVLSDPAAQPQRPDGYPMLGYLAHDPAAFRPTCVANGNLAQGYMYVLDTAEAAARQRWQGWLETGVATSLFRTDSAWQQFRRNAFEEWSARYRADGRREAPAVFYMDAGVLRVEQTVTLADGRTLRITGERVSRDVANCDRTS
jgi:hypothetical protein